MPRLLAPLLLALLPALAQAEDLIRVYNWNDYIAPEVLEEFQKETGIKVEYHTFSSAEELNKALAGGEPIDVAVPSHNDLPRLIKAGRLQPLDFSRLPNRQHLDKQLLSKLAAMDPNNQHAVPYLWGAVGLAVNTPQAEKAFGGPLPHSWSLLFDADQSARLGQCGSVFGGAPLERGVGAEYAERLFDLRGDAVERRRHRPKFTALQARDRDEERVEVRRRQVRVPGQHGVIRGRHGRPGQRQVASRVGDDEPHTVQSRDDIR